MTDTKQSLANFIDGEFVKPVEGSYSDIIDPSTGEVYATAPLSGPEDIDRAVAAAARAFAEVWRKTTPKDRMEALLKMADAIEDHAEELIKVEAKNTGKPLGLTRTDEIPVMADQIRFFAGAARNLEGRSSGEYMTDHHSMIRREPLGVVGSVAPWTYPMMMAVWKFAPVLAAGNTIAVRHHSGQRGVHGGALRRPTATRRVQRGLRRSFDRRNPRLPPSARHRVDHR
jgi:betaine-aldehyde dehydrogenase